MRIVSYAEYTEDDAEPEGVAEVVDCEGDTWYRVAGGTWRFDRGDCEDPWEVVAHDFGPLRAEIPHARHDSDCQAFQHTYISQGAPGVYVHGQGMVDAVGDNGRRLLVKEMPEGVYVGGAVFSNASAMKLAAHIELMVQQRGGPR